MINLYLALPTISEQRQLLFLRSTNPATANDLANVYHASGLHAARLRLQYVALNGEDEKIKAEHARPASRQGN